MNVETERLTPTALAFIGDAVQALYVRKRLASENDFVVGTLHSAATKYVNAEAQAFAFDELVSRGALTEAELDVARRARNAHLHSHAKASAADYHRATALEAVFGWLEVTGDCERRDSVLDMCFEIVKGRAAK